MVRSLDILKHEYWFDYELETWLILVWLEFGLEQLAHFSLSRPAIQLLIDIRQHNFHR